MENNAILTGFREKRISVSNTPDVLSEGVADMGMALLLASARNLYRGQYWLYHHIYSISIRPTVIQLNLACVLISQISRFWQSRKINLNKLWCRACSLAHLLSV